MKKLVTPVLAVLLIISIFVALDYRREAQLWREDCLKMSDTIKSATVDLEKLLAEYKAHSLPSLSQGVYKDGDETLVTYGSYGASYPLQLVVNNKNGRVSLRITAPNSDHEISYNDDVIKFMRKEVERFASAHDLVPLGKSDMFFRFSMGYPIWAPYHSMSGYNQEICLYFSDNGAMTSNGYIMANGTTNHVGFWPYEIAGKN